MLDLKINLLRGARGVTLEITGVRFFQHMGAPQFLARCLLLS